MSHDLRKFQKASQVVHAGQSVDPTTGSVAPPLYQTSTFAFETAAQGAARFAGTEPGFIYTRMGNPTIQRLEEAVTALEGGAAGFATSSGMAALNTILFAFLKSGDHLVGTDCVYGPSRVVVERDWARFGVTSTFVDTAKPSAIEAAIRPETKIVFIETPANPTVSLTDLAAASRAAKSAGALLVVDNTFASPILQRPIEFGADVVMHSMTKFINGHTDIVAGMVVAATMELSKKIRPAFNYLGPCMDPHQAWLALRGLRTLSLRMNASQDNAIKLAAFLERHPKVEWVRYPGLESHPQYALAQAQMDGPGALISFEVKGGIEAGRILLDNVELMTLAVSLGGVETLIQHPSSMTHAAMSQPERIKAGITDGLVRLSVGCEDVRDLIADLEHALSLV
ncbi:MAG: PLP-dependent aspartate aminotransferase family protein [Myxococcota bacterium]|jgi:methionine-gamma-lyase|nr:PLP-dependent aspartate aminotransferase family protein [Myxococcota bacterium]